MIRIDNLTFGYGHKRPLFDKLGLQLATGNIYGLLGKNGAGKSSLLKLLAGLLFPKQGSVVVDGHIPALRQPQYLQEVYFITEESDLPDMSPASYTKLYSAFYPRFDHALFEKYKGEFQLQEVKKLAEYSYGQKKKFQLAFALSTNCRLMLLDEPTNGLDIPSKSQFRKVVASAINEDRMFIISTHQVRDMENLIDPIIILNDGEVVFHQSLEQVSEKLCMSRQAHMPSAEGAVYAEQNFGGYIVVSENKRGEHTNINVETLFKAVLHDKEKMHQIFNR